MMDPVAPQTKDTFHLKSMNTRRGGVRGDWVAKITSGHMCCVLVLICVVQESEESPVLLTQDNPDTDSRLCRLVTKSCHCHVLVQIMVQAVFF